MNYNDFSSKQGSEFSTKKNSYESDDIFSTDNKIHLNLPSTLSK